MQTGKTQHDLPTPTRSPQPHSWSPASVRLPRLRSPRDGTQRRPQPEGTRHQSARPPTPAKGGVQSSVQPRATGVPHRKMGVTRLSPSDDREMPTPSAQSGPCNDCATRVQGRGARPLIISVGLESPKGLSPRALGPITEGRKGKHTRAGHGGRRDHITPLFFPINPWSSSAGGHWEVFPGCCGPPPALCTVLCTHGLIIDLVGVSKMRDKR